MRSTREPVRPIARIAAVIEQLALAVWIGGLIGFAFLTAPAAFHIVSNLDQFASLTGKVLSELSRVGYWCGGIAIVAAIVRSIDAADRTWDLIRAAILVLMLGGAAYQANAVAPAMSDTLKGMGGSFGSVAESDPRRQEYRRLHDESTRVYGVVVFLGLVTIAIAAARGID